MFCQVITYSQFLVLIASLVARDRVVAFSVLCSSLVIVPLRARVASLFCKRFCECDRFPWLLPALLVRSGFVRGASVVAVIRARQRFRFANKAAHPTPRTLPFCLTLVGVRLISPL